MDKTKKKILGLTEEVIIINTHGEKKVHAKIDTGASTSSIDAKLASQLKLGPVCKAITVKSANGKELRPVIKTKIKILGEIYNAHFTIADRRNLTYRVLIGLDILKKGFIVDPRKNTLRK